ncbi:transposase [Streptomyces sioyaensis]|uniref:transposase n=1 Tax=Streptomyces sioyaensis TaxID=67364 RepID=UPI0037CFBEB3
MGQLELLVSRWRRYVAQKCKNFSPEFKDEAVRMVIEQPWTIAQVARELGIVAGTLGNWVNDVTQLRPCPTCQLAVVPDMASGRWGWIVPDGLWEVAKPLLPPANGVDRM